MPELPEVEIVVLGLRKVLIGHCLQKVVIKRRQSFEINPQSLKQLLFSQVINIRRFGKIIIIDLDNQKSLLIHLKLTGQLVYRNATQVNTNFGGGHPNDSLIGNLPDTTTKVIFYFDKDGILFFNDVRSFGWVKLLPTQQVEVNNPVNKLGVDALVISKQEFVRLLQKRLKNIKACLLDQTIIAGCGNIYADESLWLSCIHPQQSAISLKKNQLLCLRKNLQQVLKQSIKQGGSSSKNYINVFGEKGNYLANANVYQKTNQPCKRCKNSIKRIVVAGRGTHICELCQLKF